MTTISYNESVNIEREKTNLLNLVELTLTTLIDQASSATASATLDDRNANVTNFIITLERILSFRMRATWLKERSYFWDFIRPACIGSCRQSIIERVEEVSSSRNSKDKGRAWIKFALMEKKLSELLKLVISDCHLVRKFYHDDSIMTSSQAFVICDRLAALNTIDFSFCFKQDGLIIAPILLNNADIDVIDLSPFLCYKSKYVKQVFRDQDDNNEEDQQSSPNSSSINDFKSVNPSVSNVISMEKYKLEVEQRKYFEELLRHRDHEFQQLKIRYDTLKGERVSEIVQMENIILELQLELRAAREEAELRRKKFQQPGSTTPPKNSSPTETVKINSPPTSRNTMPIRSLETIDNSPKKQSNDLVYQTSPRSSDSTTTSNTDDDQYEYARKLPSNSNHDSNQPLTGIKSISSPEMISSVTSLSSSSISSSNDEEKSQNQTLTTSTPDEKTSLVDESSRLQSIKVTVG